MEGSHGGGYANECIVLWRLCDMNMPPHGASFQKKNNRDGCYHVACSIHQDSIDMLIFQLPEPLPLRWVSSCYFLSGHLWNNPTHWATATFSRQAMDEGEDTTVLSTAASYPNGKEPFPSQTKETPHILMDALFFGSFFGKYYFPLHTLVGRYSICDARSFANKKWQP